MKFRCWNCGLIGNGPGGHVVEKGIRCNFCGVYLSKKDLITSQGEDSEQDNSQHSGSAGA